MEIYQEVPILLGKLPTICAYVAFLVGYHTVSTLCVEYNVS